MFICVQEICTFLLDRKSLLSFPSGLEVCGIEIEVCNVKYNFLPAPSFMAVSMSFAEASPEKKEVCSSYDALTNFFFRWGGEGGLGGGKRKGGGKGMGGLIISRFHLLYFSPSSSSTQKTENVCNFKVFKSDFETLPNQSWSLLDKISAH